MTLSRSLTAKAGFCALTLAAAGGAAVSASSSSEPTAWTAAAAPAAQVHLVSSTTGTVTGSAATTATTAGSTTGAGTTAAAAGATTPTDATEESPEHERCEASLPSIVVGDPGATAGDIAGFRVWHDGSGWHVRATHHGSDPVAFSGVVRSGQPITATGYKLEKGDTMTLSKDRRTLTFALVNHGGLDGVDFTDRCAIHTTFTLRRAGHQVPTTAVFLGAHGGHPTSNPFQIERHRH